MNEQRATLTKPDHGYRRTVELACIEKRVFPTLDAAEAWAGRHYACHICQDGTSRMTGYPCHIDPSHYHSGHMGTGGRS